MMPVRPTSEKHAWLDIDGEVRNWRNSYDGSQSAMGCRANPVRQIAEAVNRCLGRYPMPWAQMSWPITSNGASACEENGSNPFVNFGRWDYTRNARSASVRVMTLKRSTNAEQNSFLEMSHNASEATPIHTDWTNDPRTCADTWCDSFRIDRGAEQNGFVGYGMNTYGGYRALDIVVQDTELAWIDANADVWDSVDPSKATSGREILADLMGNMRAAFHRARMGNHGFQASWMGYGQENAWQDPPQTNECAIVATSNVFVNLINQSWTTRNSESPGIECVAYRRGRGHQSVAAGTVIPVSCSFLAESNAAAPAGNAVINVHGAVDTAAVNIPANVLQWYTVNVSLNTALDPINAENGVNKLDVYGKVANSGTDTLRVRGVIVHSWTN